MICIGICDDDSKMRKSLRTPIERKLQLLGDEYQILEFASGESLLSSDYANGIDILFLDIEMNGISGVETAKAIRKTNLETTIIFVTAYPDFVFQGYEVHAYHYILKPYDEAKILSVFEQAIVDASLHKERFFTITHKSGIQNVAFSQILAFKSCARKILIITLTDEIEFYGKINEIIDTLPNYFVRIHNRYIVNLNYISSIENNMCVCKRLSFPISNTYRISLEVAYAKILLH